MKKILFLLMMVSAACLFNSCSKDDDDNVVEVVPKEDNNQQTNNQVEEPRYYVKYEVTCTTSKLSVNRTYTFNTETGEQTVKSVNSTKTTTWEGTYGPVKKGFQTSLRCNVETEYTSSCHGRIYVCREKEPFVIKAEGTGNTSLNLSYKIDF